MSSLKGSVVHLGPVVVRSFVVMFLVAIGLGGFVVQQAAAQDVAADTITVSITSYNFAEPEGTNDSSGFPNLYNYGQNYPAMQGGITLAAPGSQTILIFAAEGAILGQGTIGDDSSVEIEITAGIPFFIIDSEDTGDGSYVVSGETDESWNVLYNPDAGQVAVPTEELGQGDGPGGEALAEFEVATYACPAGYTAPDVDPLESATVTCVDPQSGVELAVRPRVNEGQPTFLTTGDSGYAVAGLPTSDAGYDIAVTLPSGALGYLVVCSRDDGDYPTVVYTATGFQVQNATATGDGFGCDVFFIFGGSEASDTASARPSASTTSGTSPTASASGAGNVVIGLPSTGTGPASSSTSIVLLAVVSVLILVLGGLVMRRRIS